MSGFAVDDRVAWLEDTVDGVPVVYAAALPDGPPISLEGTGATIFVAALGGGTLEEIVERVSELAGAPAAAVHPDVVAFLQRLVELGVVSRTT